MIAKCSQELGSPRCREEVNEMMKFYAGPLFSFPKSRLSVAQKG
jgi:hypothetical protein